MARSKKAGISGRVSDYSESERIVEDRPDGPHIQIYDMPVEEDYPNCGPGQEHDVVVREARGNTGWPVDSSFGAFDGPRDAVDFAVTKAEEEDLPLWDTIERLVRDPGRSE